MGPLAAAAGILALLCGAAAAALGGSAARRHGSARGEHDDTSACIAKNSRNGGWIRLFAAVLAAAFALFFHRCGNSRNDADAAAEDCPDG